MAVEHTDLAENVTLHSQMEDLEELTSQIKDLRAQMKTEQMTSTMLHSTLEAAQAHGNEVHQRVPVAAQVDSFIS